jgi:hypothetical protein
MTAGSTENGWLAEAALYVLFPGAEAVMVHKPTPVVVPLVVHGPEAENITVCPEEAVALNGNVPPYCTFGNGPKLMVCDRRLEPLGRIVNVPDTGSAEM